MRNGMWSAVILVLVGGCAASLPAVVVTKEKLSGDTPHLPDEVKAQHLGETLTGTYKICVATDGTVKAVKSIEPIPGADEAIMTTLMQWTYRPPAVPVCFIDRFQFAIGAPSPAQ